MKKEESIKDIYFIAKKSLRKPIIEKILLIKDKKEQKILFEYSIKSAMELKYAELKERIKNLDEQKKDTFIILTKLHLLGSKVHFFYATMDKKDFQNIMKLFNEIEKEVKKL